MEKVKFLGVRITEDEHKAIELLARNKGLGKSTLARMIIREALGTPEYVAFFPETLQKSLQIGLRLQGGIQ